MSVSENKSEDTFIYRIAIKHLISFSFYFRAILKQRSCQLCIIWQGVMWKYRSGRWSLGDDSDVKSSAVPAKGIDSVPSPHVFTTSWNWRSRLWWCLMVLQVPYMHRGCTQIYPCKHAFSQNKNQKFKDRVINMHTCIVIKEYFSYNFFGNPNLHMVIFESEVPKKT